MDREQLKRIIDDSEEYNPTKEDTIRTMLSDFYNRKMLSMVILVWALGLAFMGGAIICAVGFFENVETKDQIMYAALFICFIQFVGQIKVFAWQMIHRNSLKREIKRLELRIAELPQALAGK